MRADLLARLRESTARKKGLLGPLPCRHLGAATHETTLCDACGGTKTRLKLFACAVFGRCLPYNRADGVASCVGCVKYEAPDLPPAPAPS